MRRRQLSLVFALLALGMLLPLGGAVASDTEAVGLEDLAWLAGAWQGTCFAKQCEETWNAPSAGTMVGTFKLYDGDEVDFYEIMLITRHEGQWVLKVKHFAADFTAWEEGAEAVHFPLQSVEPGVISWGGLKMERKGEDGLSLTLRMRSKDGSTRDEKMEMRRVR